MAHDQPWRLLVSQAVRDTPGLPPEDIASVERLLDAEQLALAFETFCTQLYEHEVALPDRAYDYFHHLAHQLNVDRRVVWLLRDNAARVTSGASEPGARPPNHRDVEGRGRVRRIT